MDIPHRRLYFLTKGCKIMLHVLISLASFLLCVLIITWQVYAYRNTVVPDIFTASKAYSETVYALLSMASAVLCAGTALVTSIMYTISPKSIHPVNDFLALIMICLADFIFISALIKTYYTVWYDREHGTSRVFIDDGIFAHSRNPQAVTALLLLAGIALSDASWGSLFIGVVGIALITATVIVKEKTLMANDEYKKYAGRVHVLWGKQKYKLSEVFSDGTAAGSDSDINMNDIDRNEDDTDTEDTETDSAQTSDADQDSSDTVMED